MIMFIRISSKKGTMVRNYEDDIIKEVLKGRKKKTDIADKIKGHRSKIFDVINDLCKREILEMDNEDMIVIKPNDVTKDHEYFQELLKQYKETLRWTMPQIKKIMKETKKPLFWSTITNKGHPELEAIQFHINMRARDEVLSFVMHAVKNLVSNSFIIYQKIILDQVSQSYKKILNEDLKSGILLIKQFKEELLKIAGPKNKENLESYWFAVTVGLRI